MSNEYTDRVIRKLEEKIAYTFKDKKLLITALTHTSFINENTMISKNDSADYYLGHNERLEFLGDAVLEIIITDELFHRCPHEREGALTNLRSSLVNEKCLVEMAKKIDLPSAIRLGVGEEKQGGRNKNSIVADCFEALLAAIYLDAKNAQLPDPIKPARDLIIDLYGKKWYIQSAINKKKDSKTLLQELTQATFKKAPKYRLVSADGPGHKQVFVVELLLPNESTIVESGDSRRVAEQKAATKALQMLMDK